MSRAPGRGVTCGARWPKKLLSRPAPSLLITDNRPALSSICFLAENATSTPLASWPLREQKILPPAGLKAKVRMGTDGRVDNLDICFCWLKQCQSKLDIAPLKALDHLTTFTFVQLPDGYYDISRDCVLCWLKQCPWKLDIAPLDVLTGSTVTARRLVCLENLSLIRWYS